MRAPLYTSHGQVFYDTKCTCKDGPKIVREYVKEASGHLLVCGVCRSYRDSGGTPFTMFQFLSGLVK